MFLIDSQKNKAIFAKLFAQKAELEAAFGSSLEWRELPEKRASRILATCDHDFILSNKETWSLAIEWLASSMERLYNAFKKAVDAAVKVS